MKSIHSYNSEIRQCASRYVTTLGLPYEQVRNSKLIQEDVNMCIADLFEAMPHDPLNCLVRASYEKFAQEIIAQYHFAIQDMRLCVEPWLANGQPYKNSCEMMEDIRLHKHLYFFTTKSGYGENSDLDNPLQVETHIKIKGHRLLVNDMFRVIHDLFGHAKEGYPFGSVGEDNAWLEHSRLFTPLARPALTTETRGQTRWFYFGAHLRDEGGNLIKRGEIGWLPLSLRPYPAQKAGLLPAEISGVKLSTVDNFSHIQVQEIEGWEPTCISRNGRSGSPKL